MYLSVFRFKQPLHTYLREDKTLKNWWNIGFCVGNSSLKVVCNYNNVFTKYLLKNKNKCFISRILNTYIIVTINSFLREHMFIYQLLLQVGIYCKLVQCVFPSFFCFPKFWEQKEMSTQMLTTLLYQYF